MRTSHGGSHGRWVQGLKDLVYSLMQKFENTSVLVPFPRVRYLHVLNGPEN